MAGFGRQVGVEAAAEALAYGWEHWERVRSMQNPAGYVFVVGRDRARRLAGDRRVVPIADAGVAEVSSFGAPDVEPGLEAAVARLSERQRIAVLLVEGAQWTLAEVVDLLGVSRGTVKRHLTRGIDRLRAEMAVTT